MAADLVNEWFAKQEADESAALDKQLTFFVSVRKSAPW